MVDAILLVSVMIDGKYKYLKPPTLQWNIETSSVYYVFYWWFLLYFKINKKIILANKTF